MTSRLGLHLASAVAVILVGLGAGSYQPAGPGHDGRSDAALDVSSCYPFTHTSGFSIATVLASPARSADSTTALTSL